MKTMFPWRPRGSGQRYLLPVSLVALGLWLTWLSLDSWTYRQVLAGQPVPSAAPSASAEKRLPAPLDDHNIARVFGAVPVEFDSAQASLPLVLLASLLGNQPEQSRALIQYADSRAFYSPGERLPDGTLLKSISADQVVVLRNGREQNLLLPGRQMRLLSPQTTPPEVADRKATALLRAIENTP
ncbi:type II secretion system protein N [Pseudomonas chlororaphis]|uniref:type II secretion system protein N n=1 Tax=Pseudomonas chlororaphis TaxID=587753 RepID=UPI0023689F02|nr:type II secretion system protein N [Pseudomonas chlororaphis]WDG82234.1 type II secretion system protein N [Pseudomonas chlororaphis]WDG84712.1 type II secretion system protein N [Pseudomonas chlororaphis]